jgi:hypothetical protein
MDLFTDLSVMLFYKIMQDLSTWRLNNQYIDLISISIMIVQSS